MRGLDLGHLRLRLEVGDRGLGLREGGLEDRELDLSLLQRDHFSVGLRLVLEVRKRGLRERGLGLSLHLGHQDLVLRQRRLTLGQ